MPSKKIKKGGDRLSIRSKELRARIDALVAENPGRVDLSSLVRTAVEEKLDRIEGGQDEGLRLKLPQKK